MIFELIYSITIKTEMVLYYNPLEVLSPLTIVRKDNISTSGSRVAVNRAGDKRYRKIRRIGNRMEKTLLEKTICIWGTGKYASILINQLKMYDKIVKKIWNYNLESMISFFVDNNIEKQGTTIFGKKIHSVNYFGLQNTDLCVVATLSRREIYANLEKKGKKHHKDYVSSEEFIEMLKNSILSRRRFIFSKMGLEDLNQETNIDILAQNIKREIDKYDDEILKYVVFSILVDEWKIDRNNCFHILQKYFDDSFIIAAFEWYFGNNITEISKWYVSRPVNYKKKKDNLTIGMLIYDYYGGGIEKVVSLLIPMFIKHGHKVVLITDSIEKDKEFDIPKECIRYVMNNKMDASPEERIAELRKCVVHFGIDIMCFHSGYGYLSTFYEMWGIRLMSIPVIMELHSFFYSIISEKREVSKYYADMYKMADAIVVLSETDKLFWESLNCNCVYIPNPVEYNSEYIEQIENQKRETNGHTIIWVGRLVQLPKRVLDVVPIMKKVIEKVPDAKLKLIGNAASEKILFELKQLIKSNGLEVPIEICGYEPNIKKIYKDADVMLLTSESESFCNVIMESKIWGVPLVLYDMPWLELLKDGEGFLAVEPQNIDEISKALITLLQDDKKRKELGEKARASIQRFVKHDVYNDWHVTFERVYKNDARILNANKSFSIIINKLLDDFYNEGI